jgi:hypothetical protein
MKLLLVLSMILCSLTTAAAGISHKIRLDGLKVIKAEATRFHAFLVLMNESQTSRVTVSCTDGYGPLQSIVTVTTVSENKLARSLSFAGTDFYCYAASRLTEKLSHDEMVNFDLVFVDEKSRSIVTFAEVSYADGSASFDTHDIKTFHWIKLQ